MSPRVTATPPHTSVQPGETATFGLTVTNESDIVDAFHPMVFGVDPKWVDAIPASLSLFPGETATMAVRVKLPESHPASVRNLAVNVQSASDSSRFDVVQVGVTVAPRPEITARVEPNVVTGGSRATFVMVVRNSGNAPATIIPSGLDPEALARFDFGPPEAVLQQGESLLVKATAIGRGRSWFGHPRPRPLTLGVRDTPIELPVVFLQRPRISRWIVSLIGLLAAATVFALLFHSAFADVSRKADANSDAVELALQADATGDDRTIPVERTAVVTGRVISSTNDQGLSGLEARLYEVGEDGAEPPDEPVAVAVTGEGGEFSIGGLAAGTYRLELSGAGFVPVWYALDESGTSLPTFVGSDTAGGATVIEVSNDDAQVSLRQIVIGGRPGSISGTVVVEDPTGAIARLLLPDRGAASDEAPAIVREVPVAGDGTFQFLGVPSPATYTLEIERPGYAVESRTIELGAAEALDGLEVPLRSGSGLITGLVTSGTTGLGGAVIVATDGSTSVTTVSSTDGGDLGRFNLRNLPVPGRYSVTVTLDDYTSETRTVLLEGGSDSAGQAEVTFQLSSTIGSLSGTVSIRNPVSPSAPGGAAEMPAGGVTVTVVGADFEAETTSLSDGGTWTIERVPVPGAFTITFSLDGYLPDVQIVDLPQTTSVNGVLLRDAGVIAGTVRRQRLGDLQAVPLAEVTATRGEQVYTTFSADDPPGVFEFGNLPPGSYTVRAKARGSIEAVQLVTLLPAGSTNLDLRIGAQAAVVGRVLRSDPGSPLVPVANAPVKLIPLADFLRTEANALEACTDGTGRFEFTDFVANQRYVVAVLRVPTDPAAEALDSFEVETFDGVEINLTDDGRDLQIVRQFPTDPLVVPQCR